MTDSPLFGAFQPEDVLDGELPAAPTELEPGEWFPIARWRSGRFGAVLYFYKKRDDELTASTFEYEEEIAILEHINNEWADCVTGGGSWVNPFTRNSTQIEEAGILETRMEIAGADRRVVVLGGLCAADVAQVVIEQAGTSIVTALDRFPRAFLVGAEVPPEAIVRALDADGAPVSRSQRRIEWILR